jgi:hypothetical protein
MAHAFVDGYRFHYLSLPAQRLVLAAKGLCSRKLEGVVGGLLDADTFKMSGEGDTAQDLLALDGKIFRGGDGCAEFLKLVQILMIEAVEDFAGDDGVKMGEIAEHSGGGGDGAADGDLKKIIVSVAVGIVALAVGFAVGVGGEQGIMQAMGRGEEVAAGEIYLHGYSP